MKSNRRYLVAVALLAVLAVVFGLAGTVTADWEFAVPEQSSSSSPSLVTHFINPPTYDSGWLDIQDKAGQYFDLTHGLGTREVFVYITGKILSATSGEPAWNKTYGGEGHDSASSVVQTNDGGYALAGSGFANLVKTDANGLQQWNKSYGGDARSVVQTSDGGYAIGGSLPPMGTGGSDFWLLKTDSAGNMQWSKTYGGANEDWGFSVVQTGDGGYAIGGSTGDPSDVWLVKTDSAGNMEWSKTYGGAGYDRASSVVQTSDGGYALGGGTDSYGAGNGDVWLVKTDSAGNMQWSKTYGGTSGDWASSLVQTSDGYALGGGTYSYGAGSCDFWLVKTDSAGNMQWSKTYGGTSGDNANSVVQTSDGGYALGGGTYSYAPGGEFWLGDFWLVKTDSAGNIEWSKTYGGSDHDWGTSVVQTSDGGYAIVGGTESYGASESWPPEYRTEDFWLVRVSAVVERHHQRNYGTASGLTWTSLSNSTITLYRGPTDTYWDYVRVRIWLIKEPTWQYGDINMDGVVDIKDLYILSRNYGKTFSLLSLSGIIAIAGIHTYRKRKQ